MHQSQHHIESVNATTSIDQMLLIFTTVHLIPCDHAEIKVQEVCSKKLIHIVVVTNLFMFYHPCQS